jgi:hypothetical protein
MSHDRDLADQDVEEVAEELWTLGEQGRDRLEDLRESSQVALLEPALAKLAARGLARIRGDRVVLTPKAGSSRSCRCGATGWERPCSRRFSRSRTTAPSIGPPASSSTCSETA